MKSYPTTEWAVTAPSQLGFDIEKLDLARQWMAEKSASRPYRFLVLRDGQIALEVNIGMEPDRQVPIASAAKSVYSNLLGIIIQERKLNFYPHQRGVHLLHDILQPTSLKNLL